MIWRYVVGFGVGLLLLLLFPPFVNLLQTRGRYVERGAGLRISVCPSIIGAVVRFLFKADDKALVSAGRFGRAGRIDLAAARVFTGLARWQWR